MKENPYASTTLSLKISSEHLKRILSLCDKSGGNQSQIARAALTIGLDAIGAKKSALKDLVKIGRLVNRK